jgi:uncharacterized damage-inducible protein DinB
MDLVKLADYHLWANDRVRSILKDLSQDEYEKDLIPPLGSIKGHVIHTILACEYNFLTKLDGKKVDVGSIVDRIAGIGIDEMRNYWREIDQELVKLASTHLDLQATFPNFLGEGEMIVNHDDFFMQYMIHTAYHRSQIMSAMRMLGKEGIGTDYLFYLSSLHNST